MKDLNIIPILVVSNTQNKAEMLNGLLRSEGLAVHPHWVNTVENWEEQKITPELVFYFDDIGKPTLKEVLTATRDMAVALIVVSPKHDQVRAAAAIELGAAAQVCLADTALLAGIARREHHNRGDRAKLKALRHELEQNNLQLRNLLAGAHDAIAYTQEGLITRVNSAWVEYFGYSKPDDLIDLPILDLFGTADLDTLKKTLRMLKRGKSIDTPIECNARRMNGSELGAELRLGTTVIEGEKQIQFTLTSNKNNTDKNSIALKHMDVLETEKRLLIRKLDSLRQCEPDSQLLWPSTFATLAGERINRPMAGTARALIAFHPANPQETLSTFGLLGLSEAGTSIAAMLSPLLEDEDIAVRIDPLTILAIVNRTTDKKIQAWCKTVLSALGEHIFESSNRSSLLGFVAGIAPIDRVRHLEQLIHQATNAARGAAGSVNMVAVPTKITTADMDDAGWSALISEALEERRFAIALRPIEDLSGTNKFHEVTARLLDREGREIDPSIFMEPATRSGFIQSIEQRLVGHAFMTLLHLLKTDKNSRVIVPLSPSVMNDPGFVDFILLLIKRTQAQLPVKSLIFELLLKDAINHIIEVENFTEKLQKLHCGFGIRSYMPSDNANKILKKLSITSLRIAPDCISKLGKDEELAKRIEQLTIRLKAEQCHVIASGVDDANIMAQLYNLGLSTMEGDAIGGAEILSSKNPMFEALYSKN